MPPRIRSLILVLIFCLASLDLHAQPLLNLPEPGTTVLLSSAFRPAVLKGVTINPKNPLAFDFILDPGEQVSDLAALKTEAQRLINYFLASLAVPEQDLWVNLSPFEQHRIVPETLGKTEMGRDLLAQDYLLKQITASLVDPKSKIGAGFWQSVYATAPEKNVAISRQALSKVWIVADQAKVVERGQTAVVAASHLKVMLEEDHLSMERHGIKAPSSVAADLVRTYVLPQLEREVNTGRNFAPLRQIVHSLILASWYKNSLRQALLNQSYSNKQVVRGIDLADQTLKQQIYDRYVSAYKKGVFHFVKQTELGPRKYFAGGTELAGPLTHPEISRAQGEFDGAMNSFGRQLKLVSVEMAINQSEPTFNQNQEKLERRFITGNVESQTSRAMIAPISGDNAGGIYWVPPRTDLVQMGVHLEKWDAQKVMSGGLTYDYLGKIILYNGIEAWAFTPKQFGDMANFAREEQPRQFGNFMFLLTSQRDSRIRQKELADQINAQVNAEHEFQHLADSNQIRMIVPLPDLPLSSTANDPESKAKRRFFEIVRQQVMADVAKALLPPPVQEDGVVMNKQVEAIVNKLIAGPIKMGDVTVSARIQNDVMPKGRNGVRLVNPRLVVSLDADTPVVDRAQVNGGIDVRNLSPQIQKQGAGVTMSVDRALTAQIKREGIFSLRPVITQIRTFDPKKSVARP